MAGVIKMVLAMQHGVLPQTLNVDEPSSHVDWSAGDVKLLTELTEWPETGRPRRAGVSSFGLSGTNAHVVLEQAPDTVAEDALAAPSAALPAVPWVVSARSPEALKAQARRLASLVRARPDLDPRDVGLSLATTRSVFEHRAVVIGPDCSALADGAEAVAAGESGLGVVVGAARTDGKSAFLFAGQGAQRAGMGRELYDAFPVFADAFDAVCAAMDGELDQPLREVVFGDDDEVLGRTEFTQPALFAVEVALFRLVESWGIRPDFLVGHSIGELAAAYVAGVWSLADACKVVAARGRLMQALPSGGAMVALQASEDEVLPLLAGLEDRAGIAALNGPAATVVAGESAVVDQVADAVKALGRKVSRLRVSHAFHSPLMEPMLADFRAVLESVEFGQPSLAVVSNVTGRAATAAELGSVDYWVGHVRQPVRFADGLSWLASQRATRFLEIGPDGTLTAMAQGTLVSQDTLTVPALRKDRPEAEALLTALARVHVHGGGVDWAEVFRGSGGRRVELPTYAFQRERYWPVPAPVSSNSGSGMDAGFWDVVERGDVDALAGQLGLGEGALDDVVPALSSWWRGQREQSVVDRWRYRVAWQLAQVKSESDRLTGRWLALVSEASLTDATAVEALRELADSVELVVCHPGADRGELAGVLREAATSGPVDGVVSLLAFPGGGGDASADGGPTAVPAGVSSTVALVQALGDAELSARLWVLTRGAVATAGSDGAPDPDQAAVWGLGRVAALEHPDRWGGLVDLPGGLDGWAAGWLVSLLADGSEDQVALRSSGVFARRLVHAPAAPVTADDAWVLGGSVLVTGGTGALGARVARWAIERGAQHVVLTSRRGSDAPGAVELEAELAALGARVTVEACDVADRDAVARLLDEHTIDAVFHAAGVADVTPFAELDGKRLEEVLTAKVLGAVHLDELTEGLELSAFVVFSSIAGVWGSGGQPAYAAANAHLDALVESRRARGLAGTAVAWGPWAESGMAAGAEAEEQLRRRGLPALPPANALLALQRALEGGDGTVTVADVDWERFAPAFTSRRPSPLLSGLEEVRRALEADVPRSGESAGAGLAEELAELSAEERSLTLVNLVRGRAAEVLGFAGRDGVEATRAFKDMGLDSLTALELRNALSGATGLSLPSTLVFDYPTPAALADYLDGRMGGEEAETGAALLADLERTAARIGKASLDHDVRVLLKARLKNLLTAMDEVVDEDSKAAVTEQLDEATDDELFDFINTQLGRS